ncbi:MAG TPA: 50S ribosomal protein L9 [Armatimonadota bacterium]|nr:50S ribosomal protein L9 [Armatimonadota bacterium]
MKVILNEEVLGLGEPGKIVDVAPGYARNFLVPRKLAVYASTASVRELEHHKRRLERKRQRLALAAQGVAERINGKTVTIETRAGENGKLYGSVTTADIAKALKDQYDVDVDRRKIALGEPIRVVGNHEVDVRLMGDTHATVIVNAFDPSQVKAEEAPAAEEAPTTEA